MHFPSCDDRSIPMQETGREVGVDRVEWECPLCGWREIRVSTHEPAGE